jgi:hypothetical protein
VIAFGCSVTKPDLYRLCAEPGIRRAAEPDSQMFALPSAGSIFDSYNAILDRAAEYDDLEALVLVHQDTEIVDAGFCAKVRAAFADPDVAVAGCVGAVGVRSLAWWEGSVSLASFSHRHAEHGGGDLPGFSWDWDEAPPYARVGEVDTVDGFLLVLSPWAVRTVRFDAALGQLHGYDFDYCLQVRATGRKVITIDSSAIHSHSLELVSEPETWIQAHMQLAEKWDGLMPGVGWAPGAWEERALRAAAERDAELAGDHSDVVWRDARIRQLERGLVEARTSISWRITAPLRLVARLFAFAR